MPDEINRTADGLDNDENLAREVCPTAQLGSKSQAPEQMSMGRYLATRFSTLKPPMNKAPNPIKLLFMLNRRQWAFFFIGFIAWVCPPV
jgi:SHS family lactate transporter-like MFS transporter